MEEQQMDYDDKREESEMMENAERRSIEATKRTIEAERRIIESEIRIIEAELHIDKAKAEYAILRKRAKELGIMDSIRVLCNVVVVQEDADCYAATDVATSVISRGKTYEESLTNLKEALEFYYESEPVRESKPASFTALEIII